MGRIFVGDEGTVFTFTVSDDQGTVNLTQASQLTASFLRSNGTKFQKTVTVTNAAGGVCTATLAATDLNAPGVYLFQVNVQFSDGKKFSGEPQSFEVEAKL